MLTTFIFGMGVVRVVMGLTPFLVAKLGARLLGFPPEHDNATTRLMSRFFGVRDAGQGVLAFYGLAHPPMLPFVLLFNGFTDVGDLMSSSIPLLRREGLDRAAWICVAMAAAAALSWFTAFSLLA